MPSASAFGEPIGSTNDDDADDSVVSPAETSESLRDDLEAAIADVEGEVYAEDAAPERTREEDKQKAPEDSPSEQAYPEDVEKYPTLTTERVQKAPEGWRPAARENFDSLPEATRREIHRRELDIQGGLAQAAEARKFTEQFEKTVEPFKAIIAAEGAESPIAAVEALMQTTAVLSMGTPQQKAARISQLISHYGIDLDTLDEVLSAEISGTPQQQAQNDPIQSLLEQRLKPVEEFMQNINGQLEQTQQTQQAAVAQEVTSWSEGKEFLEDVRLDMADLLDMSKARGRNMTLDEAYTAACNMNPEVSRVVQQRELSQSTATRRSSVAEKVAASRVSRSPNQVGSGSPANPAGDGSIRGALLASINQLENPD